MNAACEHYGKCPSASGWCIGTGPDARCIPFLRSAVMRLNGEIVRNTELKDEAEAILRKLDRLRETD